MDSTPEQDIISYAYQCAKYAAAKMPQQEQEDAIQNALAALVEAWPSYNPARSSKRTFAASIVRNKVATYATYAASIARRMPNTPEPPDIVKPPPSPEDALAVIPDHLKPLAQLKAMGCTQREIRNRLNLSERMYRTLMRELWEALTT